MFGYQTAAAFAVFVGFLYMIKVHLKRAIRSLNKAAFAWYMKKVNDELPKHKMVDDFRYKIFSCLPECCEKDRNLKLVEIGCGSGPNFKYFPANTELVCIEPNDSFKKYLMSNASKFSEVELKDFHMGKAEDMSFIASGSIDAVVCSYVFCSVSDMNQSLSEILRILKKGGKFCFFEHIEAEAGSWTHFWQRIFRRPWWLVMEGCYITRRTPDYIRKAGFAHVDLEVFDLDFWNKVRGPLRPILGLVSSTCAGVATK